MEYKEILEFLTIMVLILCGLMFFWTMQLKDNVVRSKKIVKDAINYKNTPIKCTHHTWQQYTELDVDGSCIRYKCDKCKKIQAWKD